MYITLTMQRLQKKIKLTLSFLVVFNGFRWKVYKFSSL